MSAQIDCELVVPELAAIEEAARRAIRLEDIDVGTGEFLSAMSNRLLSTVGGAAVREEEAKVWLKAASALTASPAEVESARVRAIAQSPVATGSFRTFVCVGSSPPLLTSPVVAARLLTPGAPGSEPVGVAPDPSTVAPSPAAKKGKKRAAPIAEAPASPLARGSSAAALPPVATKGKTRAVPRPVRKSNRGAPVVPSTSTSQPAAAQFAPGSGYAILQELLHTDPNNPPTLLAGDFPPSAPYYIVRTIVRRLKSSPSRRSLNLLS